MWIKTWIEKRQKCGGLSSLRKGLKDEDALAYYHNFI